MDSLSTQDPPLALEYVLPLRWHDDSGLAELTEYLGRLRQWADVTVVDGSPAEIFARHAESWRQLVRHLPVAAWPGRNGKVAGVVTGVRQARHEVVVIADDDVRYDRDSLHTVSELLVGADLVRPQNYFAPLPWHARWDTARSLLNRALGSDYPGTFAVRRSAFVAMGGYDGDVLFENLELSRTVRVAGGREVRAGGVFVARRPPSTRHFLGQRVRQAYDDLAQPARLVAEAAIVPLVVSMVRTAATGSPAARRSARRQLAGALALAVGVAEVGRRRSGGRSVFPASSALWAPAWIAERAVCIWVALGYRLTGGVPYAGRRLATAAHSVRWLRRHLDLDLTLRSPSGLSRSRHHQQHPDQGNDSADHEPLRVPGHEAAWDEVEPLAHPEQADEHRHQAKAGEQAVP
jgi:hypothetical protein